MRSRHADKLWAVGGVLGAGLLLALGWFFFIRPQYAETASLNDQVVQAELRLTSSNARSPSCASRTRTCRSTRRSWTAATAALPATPESSNFLRQLQAAGEDGGRVGHRAHHRRRARRSLGAAGAVYALPVAPDRGGHATAGWRASSTSCSRCSRERC